MFTERTKEAPCVDIYHHSSINEVEREETMHTTARWEKISYRQCLGHIRTQKVINDGDLSLSYLWQWKKNGWCSLLMIFDCSTCAKKVLFPPLLTGDLIGLKGLAPKGKCQDCMSRYLFKIPFRLSNWKSISPLCFFWKKSIMEENALQKNSKLWLKLEVI